ncbi:MAG: YbfB/YjiJ family MFS transporter, partial [Thermomicrobiales bacterium]|nr:YbfB/YjiJ family MFS transporter [Thermomicrobiales bacterium]
ARFSGWFFGGVGIGIAASGLAVVAAGRLVGWPWAPWQREWLVVAVLAAILALPAGAWLPPVPIVPRRGAGRGWGGAGPILALVGTAYFLEGAGYIVTGTFIVAIVGELPGLSDLGPAVWILVGLAAAPSTVLWTLAATKTRPIATLTAAYFVQTIGIALPALSDRAGAAIASALLFGGTFMAIAALTISFAQRAAPPAQANRAIGWLTAAFGLGQIAGPLLAVALAGGGDLRPTLLVAAAAVLAGGVLVAAAGVALHSRPID